ncbi:MAG: CarD family transcriptional regulator, partial [Firmicutes bacterium]|nr:CarD family transcriptional regulator [Bacillota bacterium]
MYSIGDKVVYPMHGAGIIEAIEEKEILGEKQYYYIMAMPIGDMKVMIPTDAVDEIGLRQVIEEEETKDVIEVL